MYDVTIKKRISCMSKEDSRLVCRMCTVLYCILFTLLVSTCKFDTQISSLSTALEKKTPHLYNWLGVLCKGVCVLVHVHTHFSPYHVFECLVLLSD